MENQDKQQEKNKNVDESWKENVEKEKTNTEETAGHQYNEEHIADFNMFISSLAMQALMFLGLMPDPTNNKVQKDLTHAKYIIDTIEMLKEKTKNNLNEEESSNIEQTLYTLRMKFVELSKS